MNSSTDKRNVIDYFKYWKTEAIIKSLDHSSTMLMAAMEHWSGDLNIGGFVRNANAFNLRQIFYIGRRQWDRRGSVGSHIYKKLNHLKEINQLKTFADEHQYKIIAFENTPEAFPIETTRLPLRSILLFGEESLGLSQEALRICDMTVYINQYGSVRSLNASTASGIAMFAWNQQHRLL